MKVKDLIPGQLQVRRRRERPLPVMITSMVSMFLLTALTIGCVAPYREGDMLPGKIIKLTNGVVFPMYIAYSYGTGRMTATDPETGEVFEGTYTGVRDGFSNTATATAVLLGTNGTVLNIRMKIQIGNPPVGYGEGEDNKGRKYHIQLP